MFSSGIWNPGKDYCYCPPWIFGIPCLHGCLLFFLTVFFSVLLTIFPCVSFIEGVAISDGVLSVGVQGATHVLDVVISFGLGKFL